MRIFVERDTAICAGMGHYENARRECREKPIMPDKKKTATGGLFL